MTQGSLRTTARFLGRATRIGKACVLIAGLAGCFAATAAPVAKPPPLPDYAVIHRFGRGEGASPSSGLAQDKHGNLYGANLSSSQGDWHAIHQRGCGLIYRIAPDGKESTVFDFSDQKAARGCLVGGELLLEDGALYGGAGGGKYGLGLIWRLGFNGHYQVLHHFKPEELWGTSGVVRGADGALYGTSGSGGANRGPWGETYGGVFRLGADGQFTVLYNFRQNDPLGVTPWHGLTMGPDGLFYGTAQGSSTSTGTVFRVEASGQLTLIHTFQNNEGQGISGLSLGQDGKLYGSAYWGGGFGMGTVWRVAPDGQFELLHSFNGHDGYGPTDPPVQAPDGTWYGTTLGNLSLPFIANSTLYRMRFEGSEPTVLHQFAKKENDGGGARQRLLIGRDGAVYGVTPGTMTDRYQGHGTGTVFRHAP